MLFNLLAQTEDPFRKATIGEASLYALLGFLVVFVGIAFLIFVVWLVGKVMTKVPTGATTKESVSAERPNENVADSIAPADGEDLDAETVAVITAALMAYYQQTTPKCEFTVKRIKRI